MAVTKDWQFDIDGTTFGCDENGVSIENNKSIDGLGIPDAKTQDVELYGADGVYQNTDYNGPRVLTIPVILRGTPAAVGANMVNLMSVWEPSLTNHTLTMQLPGWGQFIILGRTRGIKVDMALANRGAIRALLRFDSADAVMTFL